MCYFFTPSAADVNAVAVRVSFKRMEGALFPASSAAVAKRLVNRDLAVFYAARLHGASLFNGADLASAAYFIVGRGKELTDHAQIVDVGLDAVIGTSANRNFELVRQFDLVISLVESLVDLFREPEGVDQTKMTGRAFAGDYGAHARTGAADLQAAGIELIQPQFANTNVDLPALPAQAYKLVQDKSCFGVMDIGGDDRGAYALGRYVPFLKEENNYRMVFVANSCRPLTRTAEEAMEVMAEIEAACGLAFTDIVNNTNLGPATDPEVVLESQDFIEKLAALSGLPLLFTAVRADLAPVLEEQIPNVFPLQLQEKYFDLPDQTFPAR